MDKIYKSIHEVLARSYFASFIFLILGIMVSLFWDYPLFNFVQVDLGFLLLILGTVLVFWSQYSSRKTKSKRVNEDTEIKKTGFAHGPYKFSRSPTHLGVFLLTAGVSFLANSFVLATASVIAFVFTKIIFVRKEERMLHEKYGEVYKDYKSKVKL